MLWAWMMSFGIAFPLLAVRAESAFRAMKSLPTTRVPPGSLPAVSIIVPARNEAANLAHLLPSLQAQRYPGKIELIVVDDGSTDGTAAVAAGHGVRVLSAGPLPPGWYGKPHACHIGAQAAEGEWLLFTDADTVHFESGLAQTVSYSMEQGLDALSLLLKQNTFGLPDAVTLMTGFAGLFAGMNSRHPILNGQFILIRKAVYEEIGGFAAVRQEALEDLALANLLHEHGLTAPVLHGNSAAEVRMYTSIAHLMQGLSRVGSGALKWSGPGSGLTVLFITGAMLPLVGVPLALYGGMPFGWLALSWVSVVTAFLPWASRLGKPQYALLAPFGALLVEMSVLSGLINTFLGRGISWKGRKV